MTPVLSVSAPGDGRGGGGGGGGGGKGREEETTFTAVDQVAQAVLGVGQAARKAEDEQRRVVSDHVEEAEGGDVGDFACRSSVHIHLYIHKSLPSFDRVLINPTGRGTIALMSSL